MAGIYFHIPFCRQACHYCDFHFSTSLRYKNELLEAMLEELRLQSGYLQGQPVSSVYFGGGTPSLLTPDEISRFMEGVSNLFLLESDLEITLEANPDDLSPEKVKGIRQTPVNRFSIGVQSFFEEDLRWMNRAHHAQEAMTAIQRVQDAGFDNITADLIYGYPLLTDKKWQFNVAGLTGLGIPHISAYSMTVEDRTALAHSIRKGKQQPMDEEQSARNFEYLIAALDAAGYEHYEISNFAKPGRYARHNSNYWKGIAYLGIGPSAHSFDGSSRQWNVSNNMKYLKAIRENRPPFEKELLTDRDVFNEYIMTSLRTNWGIDLEYVKQRFDARQHENLSRELGHFVRSKEVTLCDGKAVLTTKGKLMADHIAAELFC